MKQLISKVITYAGDFISLIYPEFCATCNAPLFRGERQLCTRCRSCLPYTRFHEAADNPVAKLFWGRVPVVYATAYFVFRKGSRFQKILHKIKYQQNQELGIEVGRWFGYELSRTCFQEIDAIVPLPLHPRKLYARGYNQSELIARGISEMMQKPMRTDWVKRVVENPTQTRKSRYERWLNVEGIFELVNLQAVEGKHLLIVDDVVTTGSTLESCAMAILKAAGARVSIAVLAMA